MCFCSAKPGPSKVRYYTEKRRKRLDNQGTRLLHLANLFPFSVCGDCFALSFQNSFSRCVLAGSIGTRPLALPVSGAVLASWPIPTKGGVVEEEEEEGASTSVSSTSCPSKLPKKEPPFDRLCVCVCARVCARSCLLACMSTHKHTHSRICVCLATRPVPGCSVEMRGKHSTSVRTPLDAFRHTRHAHHVLVTKTNMPLAMQMMPAPSKCVAFYLGSPS